MEIWICVSKVTKTVFSSPGTDWATLADTATGAPTVISNTLIDAALHNRNNST